MAEQIIAIIGSGGKTTAMELLAGQADGPVLLTTTTRIFPTGSVRCLIDPDADELTAALREGNLCAGASAEKGKLKMLPEGVLQTGIRAARTVIYEGDGSRHLPLKLHRPDEPVLLPDTGHVLVVAGLSALGKPAGEAVHRHELDARWAVDPEQPVTPADFCRCVLETADSAKLPREKIRVFLNQLDTCENPTAAAEIAEQLRQRELKTRVGNLRQAPEKLYEWIIAKEI